MVAFTPETHAYFDVCFPVLITTSPKENFQLIKKSSVQLTCGLGILGIHLWRNKDQNCHDTNTFQNDVGNS